MIKSRVVLLGVLLLLLLACQPQPIKVGAFLSLTGSTAAYGISAANAIKLATEEVNSEGRIKGRRIELEIEDDRSNAHRSGNLADRSSVNSSMKQTLPT